MIYERQLKLVIPMEKKKTFDCKLQNCIKHGAAPAAHPRSDTEGLNTKVEVHTFLMLCTYFIGAVKYIVFSR